MISLLFAMDRNHVMGKDNDLPWHLPNDLKFFKEKTIGHTIIMGRKTYESFNRPLPKRENVILTRDETYQQPGCKIIHDISEIQRWNEENPDTEWFVIGGSVLFEQILDQADRMYMTYIDETFQGDTYFPEYQEDEWELTHEEKGVKDEKNPYDYYFRTYDRVTR
ncbi:dihydrofolate reductase [Thalassobacillus cyri]|uniref:Dihydrofolate reductase n=1 Tax=Thalassobacillus cyri TaxID=571932 RepID=A0A1H4CT85_9BACI|nr:dihydrofolate reductase [Thalassobacillus cyri]SEA63528.1 dihydrofolate reductase [Thalassobacillus cyri]